MTDTSPDSTPADADDAPVARTRWHRARRRIDKGVNRVQDSLPAADMVEKPTRGKVFIGKHEISAMNETELAQFRQQHLGFIFQSYNLLPTMTAAENVALPLMFKGIDKKTRLKLARKELKSMGLLGRANHLPTEMSGGQQQRVGIARAFVSNPKVIFADEPSGNLDHSSAENLHQLFFQLRNEFGQTFVIVTHNEELANMADRKLVMMDGILQNQEQAI